MDWLWALLFAPVLAFIPAAIAKGKGLYPVDWWFYGLLLFPIAFIHALLVQPNQAELDKRRLDSGQGKRCVHCDEIIQPAAKVCRHCGRDLPLPEEESPAISGAPPPSTIGSSKTKADAYFWVFPVAALAILIWLVVQAMTSP